jgi:hypothetical protein
MCCRSSTPGITDRAAGALWIGDGWATQGAQRIEPRCVPASLALRSIAPLAQENRPFLAGSRACPLAKATENAVAAQEDYSKVRGSPWKRHVETRVVRPDQAIFQLALAQRPCALATGSRKSQRDKHGKAPESN